MGRDRRQLGEELTRHGFKQLSGPPPEQQLDFARDERKVTFALIARNDSGSLVVNGGPWAGEPWPDGMLDGSVGHLGALQCPIINLKAQIEIKEMMPVWFLRRPHRAKDLADIARLKSELSRGVSNESDDHPFIVRSVCFGTPWLRALWRPTAAAARSKIARYEER
jgi:hypothetical protein